MDSRVWAGPAPAVPAERLEALADGESLHDVRVETGVVTARARIDGVPAAVFATDPSLQGGALGHAAGRSVADAILRALRDRAPVVGIWHSAGARLQEGVAALDGMGRIFAAATAASGRVPQLSVVLGTSAGGAAYGSALTDLVITASQARLFVTGPAVVREVTGEDVDAAELGGPEVHSRHSGLVHVAAGTASEAFEVTRSLVGLAGRPSTGRTAALQPDPCLDTALPERRRRAYDVRHIISRLLDDDAPRVELHSHWAPNIVTSLGRLGGRTVGILANNPICLGGCLDGRASDKAARFVRMCDSWGVPLVVVVDVPGYLPGKKQEWHGVVRRGAKLLHAFSEATVPRVTLITRKAYGGAYIAMNSRALGATAVLAWPGAEIAVMGAEATVQVVHRRELAAVPAQRRAARVTELADAHPLQDGLEQALVLGLVDRIVAPADTRAALLAALRAAPTRSGRHGNIPL